MRRLTNEEVKKRLNDIFQGKYDFSNIEYKDYNTPIKFICPVHGEIEMLPTNLFKGKGCKKCYHEKPSKKRSQREYVIQQINDKNIMNYEIVHIGENVRHKDYIILKCNKQFKNGEVHGEFPISINNFLRGKGCPICKSSHLEKNIMECLINNNINYELHKRFSDFNEKLTQTLDFYLPDYNIAIECQGRQHFISVSHFGGKNSLEKQIERDINKYNLCKEYNINLIYFLYDSLEKIDLSNIPIEKNFYNSKNTFDNLENLLNYLNSIKQ